MQDMDAHSQLAFLSTHITAVDGLEGEIAEWGSLILENEKMTGCQRIRCSPPGIFRVNIRRRSAGPGDSETGDLGLGLGGGGQGACANGFHGKNVPKFKFMIAYFLSLAPILMCHTPNSTSRIIAAKTLFCMGAFIAFLPSRSSLGGNVVAMTR